jgi:hypothetical protein
MAGRTLISFFFFIFHATALSCYLIFIMATCETFPFDDSPIEPRPLFPTAAPEPVAPPVVLPEPREIAPRGIPEKDGPTQSEILLQAIVLEARKEQTPVTTAAMRNLIAKFASEFSLDF